MGKFKGKFWNNIEKIKKEKIDLKNEEKNKKKKKKL